MKKFIGFNIVLIFLLFFSPTVTFSQVIDPCTAPEDPCPIDSNVYFLIVGAIAVAAKKAYDYKKKQIPA